MIDDGVRLGWPINEYAAKLGVHPNTIRREIRRGVLAVSLVGTRTVITAAGHEAYMARGAAANQLVDRTATQRGRR